MSNNPKTPDTLEPVDVSNTSILIITNVDPDTGVVSVGRANVESLAAVLGINDSPPPSGPVGVANLMYAHTYSQAKGVFQVTGLDQLDYFRIELTGIKGTVAGSDYVCQMTNTDGGLDYDNVAGNHDFVYSYAYQGDAGNTVVGGLDDTGADSIQLMDSVIGSNVFYQADVVVEMFGHRNAAAYPTIDWKGTYRRNGGKLAKVSGAGSFNVAGVGTGIQFYFISGTHAPGLTVKIYGV